MAVEGKGESVKTPSDNSSMKRVRPVVRGCSERGRVRRAVRLVG